MSESKKEDYGDWCPCPGCEGYKMVGIHGIGHRSFFMLRWVLLLLVFAIIFAMGMKIGEYKGAFREGAGFRYMHNSPGMMFFENKIPYSSTGQQGTVVPPAPPIPSPK